MTPNIYIQGSNIHDIPTFYHEINRVFMQEEDWKLGISLDALDDMLYGDYGALSRTEKPVCIEWTDSEQARKKLGAEATKAHYREKIAQPETYNTTLHRQKLRDLEEGHGKTYFEIILEIFSEHTDIQLILS